MKKLLLVLLCTLGATVNVFGEFCEKDSDCTSPCPSGQERKCNKSGSSTFGLCGACVYSGTMDNR